MVLWRAFDHSSVDPRIRYSAKTYRALELNFGRQVRLTPLEGKPPPVRLAKSLFLVFSLCSQDGAQPREFYHFPQTPHS
jgi:hypothetical protein